MFRITEDPSSGNLVECLTKNFKNGSIVPSYTRTTVTICCHNTDLVHINGHDRIILVICSQALYKPP